VIKDAQNRTTSVTTTKDDGTTTTTAFDAAAVEDWSTVATSRDAAGHVTQESVVNDNGTSITTYFDPAGVQAWDRVDEVTLADGTDVRFVTDGLQQAVYVDGAVSPISSAIWTEDGAEPLEPVFYNPQAAQKAIEAALALFTWLSWKANQNETAVAAFKASEFVPGAAVDQPAIFVGTLTKPQVDAACPRHGYVQGQTSAIAAEVKASGQIHTPQSYGTAVHTELAARINGPDGYAQPIDPNFRAEVSAIKSQVERYGTQGTVRVDVIENVGAGTVCVYDIKTGKTELSPARMSEIATNVQQVYPGTQRIIVIQTKP
jgi:hypothetical protein